MPFVVNVSGSENVQERLEAEILQLTTLVSRLLMVA